MGIGITEHVWRAWGRALGTLTPESMDASMNDLEACLLTDTLMPVRLLLTVTPHGDGEEPWEAADAMREWESTRDWMLHDTEARPMTRRAACAAGILLHAEERLSYRLVAASNPDAMELFAGGLSRTMAAHAWLLWMLGRLDDAHGMAVAASHVPFLSDGVEWVRPLIGWAGNGVRPAYLDADAL